MEPRESAQVNPLPSEPIPPAPVFQEHLTKSLVGNCKSCGAPIYATYWSTPRKTLSKDGRTAVYGYGYLTETSEATCNCIALKRVTTEIEILKARERLERQYEKLERLSEEPPEAEAKETD